MKTNSAVLREVSYQLNNGNPLWGMLLANEYFNKDNPFRAVIITKFKQRINSSNGIEHELALALIEGKKRAELAEDLAPLIGQRAIKRSRTVISSSRLRTPSLRCLSRRSPTSLNSRLAKRSKTSLSRVFAQQHS